MMQAGKEGTQLNPIHSAAKRRCAPRRYPPRSAPPPRIPSALPTPPARRGPAPPNPAHPPRGSPVPPLLQLPDEPQGVARSPYLQAAAPARFAAGPAGTRRPRGGGGCLGPWAGAVTAPERGFAARIPPQRAGRRGSAVSSPVHEALHVPQERPRQLWSPTAFARCRPALRRGGTQGAQAWRFPLPWLRPRRAVIKGIGNPVLHGTLSNMQRASQQCHGCFHRIKRWFSLIEAKSVLGFLDRCAQAFQKIVPKSTNTKEQK
ncbi:serine/arginine repetitive matrix protein 1-like [Pogoniulus pusillus]|uniref:serine/arginine repetitive matrix protein 1-like n=1 Tax=Pogoniulus pusillus TaxID=488313 RepID=UPI0030B96431